MNWLQPLVMILAISSSIAEDYRLPATVVPSRYTIDLFVPDGTFTGQNQTFEGEVTIRFTVANSTSSISFHHRVEQLTSVSLATASGVNVPISFISYSNVTEIATYNASTALVVNTEYDLHIKYFNSFETDAMVGFYRSTYQDESNRTAYLVVSKFEPGNARHAFPCLDEPQLKATFLLSITYPADQSVLASTNPNYTTVVNSIYNKTTFQETTLMSTYLLAFSVSNFTCTEGYTIANGVTHGVCSRPESAPHRGWAVEFGTSVMRTLESITGIKYGTYMPKMDELAIPDFAAGAMENWGLVGYRETYLLWSEEDSSNAYKKGIATVIAHEFTHMWFGNLVTCQWWDYLFLNEGFARFYQFFGAAAVKQTLDWELDKLFNVEVVQVALLADSQKSASALTSSAVTRAEVAAKFDTITYSKGASILRMIEKNIMGPDNFIYGIRDYLTTYAQKSAIPSYLWSSFAKYTPSNVLPSGVNLSATLHNWVEGSGHPVVFVTQSGNDVVLSQERFLLSGNDTTTQYYVPITYTVSNDITTFWNTTVKQWLVPGENLIISNVLNGSDWIVLNNKQAGFYRVEYDNTLWSAIKTQLKSNHLKIDVLNRAQLISDTFNLARSGSAGGYGNWSYSSVLDLLSYLENETDYYPWYATIVGNNHLLQRVGYNTTVGNKFTSWMLNLMDKVYESVAFNTLDSNNQVYTTKQALILSKACQYGHSGCISKSKQLFDEYKNNGTKVPKNLRTIVYCNALRYSDSDDTDFRFLWQKYTETKLMTEILTLLSGMACSQNSTNLKWLLSQTINSTSGIRLQDFTTVWSYVYTSSKVGTNAALEYINENYQALSASYSSVGSLISNAANYISEEDQLVYLEALANITGISESHKNTTESALKSAQSNIDFGTKIASSVSMYLDSPSSDTTSESPDSTSDSHVFKSSYLLLITFLFLCMK
ncbi:membrane alanyl aminopeptidase-like [Anthonomus grandis grandis]|uniref:membrane alanyl aminopeptidase-like n=1 Tax=Anthonomus grandis grandis TaxID=2921223 RepID=UPI0021651927|nr:membrane alanyl aminopeptidase-like [Anthonomus grandis grandis]XP_050293248.1 membrane alanyl aminopeptidase-like [Anthonomus grandis grandis]